MGTTPTQPPSPRVAPPPAELLEELRVIADRFDDASERLVRLHIISRHEDFQLTVADTLRDTITAYLRLKNYLESCSTQSASEDPDNNKEHTP